jgi:hypothetical protein
MRFERIDKSSLTAMSAIGRKQPLIALSLSGRYWEKQTLNGGQIMVAEKSASERLLYPRNQPLA